MAAASKRKTIGILTSGGDCAGLNATIRAVTLRAHHGYGWKTVGEQTAAAYTAALDAAPEIPAGPEELWQSRQRPISIPEGNLLASAGLAA